MNEYAANERYMRCSLTIAHRAMNIEIAFFHVHHIPNLMFCSSNGYSVNINNNLPFQ